MLRSTFFQSSNFCYNVLWRRLSSHGVYEYNLLLLIFRISCSLLFFFRIFSRFCFLVVKLIIDADLRFCIPRAVTTQNDLSTLMMVLQRTETCSCVAINWIVVLAGRTMHLSILIFKHSRSRWPCGLRCRSAAARLLGLRVRVSPGAWMSFSCECCLLSGRGLCDGPISHPGESYRMCVCVIECDQVQQWPSTPTVSRYTG
jgi:hypothetical protein